MLQPKKTYAVDATWVSDMYQWDELDLFVAALSQCHELYWRYPGEDWGPNPSWVASFVPTNFPAFFKIVSSARLDYPSCPLPADGQSKAFPSYSGLSGTLSFSFDGDSLGCSLSSGGVVTAGTQAGTVTIHAESSGGCESYATVTLEEVEEPQGSACQQCPGNGGEISVRLGGAHFDFALGRGNFGETAGRLSARITAPNSEMYTPRSLFYSERKNFVITTNLNGAPRQVKSLDRLADIFENSPLQYTINFFRSSNCVPVINGLCQTNGTPFSHIVVENPNPATTNRLRISETRDGTTRTWDYYWSSNAVFLTNGTGLSVESRTTTSNSTTRTEVRQIRSGSDSPVFTEQKDFQVASWGTRLTNQIIGSGAAARTNVWVYDTNGFLVQEQRWDGQWKWHQNNAQGWPANTFSGIGTQGPTTNASLCRLTAFSYDTSAVSGSGDTGIYHTERPRRVVESVYGQEVSRKYFVFLDGVEREITCLTAEAAWDTTGNLVVTNRYFTEGFFLGEPSLVQRPDGTIVAYYYELSDDFLSFRTNVVLSGHPDATGTNVDQGTKTISVRKCTGETLSTVTIDIESTITNSSEVFSEFDADLRPRRVTYLDGTFTHTEFACCGEQTVTDREGTVTTSAYDALKRLIWQTTQSPAGSITVSNYHDAAGRLLRVTRSGADGTTVTNHAATYDDAGNTLTTSDALGNTTSYAVSTGPLVRTTTFPDNGTRIETYARDGSLATLTGTAVHGLQYSNGVDQGQAFLQETKLETNGTPTAEWVRTYSDFVGRTVRTLYADNASSTSDYNSAGQLASATDPDGVATLYFYSSLGELEYTVLDVDRDGQVDWAGPDRITQTVNDYLNNGTANVHRVRTWVWDTAANLPTLMASTETSVDGLTNWSTRFGLTTRQETYLDTATGQRTVITFPPVGVPTTNVFQHGLLLSSSLGVMGCTTNNYDYHRRLARVTDPRTGTTTNSFDAADRITAVATPSPGSGHASQVTSFYYDGRGWRIRTVFPDGDSVTNVYFPTGLPQKTVGARVYPVAYSYDYAGRMKTMTTWTDFASGAGAATTTWNYDTRRGWLTNKVHVNALGPKYGYTPAGRLASRTWARGTNTTYAYSNAGDLNGVDYSDPGMADVASTWDRLGRQTTNVQGSIATSLVYDLAGNLLSEVYSGGPLSGITVSNVYDGFLRRISNGVVSAGGGWLVLTTNSLDASNRLSEVSDRTNTAVYAYLDRSPLVESITFQQSGVTRMTTAKTYDQLNRLTSIQTTNASGVLTSFAYGYNSGNQRTGVTNADNSRWQYGYDRLGQVVSAKKYWADGTLTEGQQFEYGFDDIGNRKWAASGGNRWGMGLRYENYLANNVNEYTQRTVPGSADILGTANSNATVTILTDNNGVAAPWPGSVPGIYRTDRHGDYFRGEAWFNNATGAVYAAVTNLAVLPNGAAPEITATNNGALLRSKTPEVFAYDADGNMTTNGLWIMAWDTENRLLRMGSRNDTPTNSWRTVNFSYDWQGRRISKVVSNWNGVAWVKVTDQRLVYDGWNLLAVLNPQSSVLQSFAWGLDLSGTFQGAGGVGGLLSVNDASNGVHFAAFDGNGNVTALISATIGAETARYEYGPFGEVIRATGPMARVNPFRWSTQYTDDETDLVCYLHRYYSPSTGRWLSRDPIDEEGGVNLYAFVANDVVNLLDFLGLRDINAQEQGVLDQLSKLAEGAKQKDPEFTKAMNATIADIKALIASVKGPTDPANLRIGMSALKIWADPQKARLFAHSPGNSTCNKYVAKVLGDAGFEARITAFVFHSRIPGTGEWHDLKELGTFKVKWIIKPLKFNANGVAIELEQPMKGKGAGRDPTFGDVISYPTHVGIYLGRKLYVSSTTWAFMKDFQGVDVVIHFNNDNQEQIYRSPE